MKKRTDELAVEMQEGTLEIRSEQWGDMVVSQFVLPAGFDPTPMFKGLPHDMCPANHWGRVLEGEMHVRYADGTEEVARAGEVYHWPPPHTAWTENGLVADVLTPAAEARILDEHLKGQGAG
jgi:hypothetical protein